MSFPHEVNLLVRIQFIIVTIRWTGLAHLRKLGGDEEAFLGKEFLTRHEVRERYHLQGYLAHKKQLGLCLGLYGGPREVGCFL